MYQISCSHYFYTNESHESENRPGNSHTEGPLCLLNRALLIQLPWKYIQTSPPNQTSSDASKQARLHWCGLCS
jgi:hypothetical protein